MDERHRAYATQDEQGYFGLCVGCGWTSPHFEDLEECREFCLTHRDEETRLAEQDEESRYRALARLNDPVAFATPEESEAFRRSQADSNS